MKKPNRIDFTTEEVEALIERIENQNLEVDDFSLLANLLKAMIWMENSLREKSLSIARLKAVFGIKTESAKKLKSLLQPSKTNNGTSAGDNKESSDKDSAKGHGHRPATDYQEAELIKIAHEAFKKGSVCPECGKGKLFNLAPGTVIRIVGQPWLNVRIYKPERLRCPICQKVFTAKLPEELYTESRIDTTAKSIVSILKYRGGMPFYRQEQIQAILGNPVSDSEIWGMTRDVADCIEPVFVELCQLAANCECLHNDDTTARVLSLKRK